MITNTDNYVPYGEEWEKEMSKFPKAHLIKMLAKEFQSKPKEVEQDELWIDIEGIIVFADDWEGALRMLKSSYHITKQSKGE